MRTNAFAFSAPSNLLAGFEGRGKIGKEKRVREGE